MGERIADATCRYCGEGIDYVGGEYWATHDGEDETCSVHLDGHQPREVIEVMYSVPVVVTVNLNTREVERVRVWDEVATLDQPTEFGLQAQAQAVAEDADWPAWEIG